MALDPLKRLLDRPLPEPPAILRQGPLREGAFPSRLHDEAVAARVGRWLGVAFGVCFLTGLVSHYHQNPWDVLAVPPLPAWGYRVSQGAHVATGIASIPLLLVKLWTVYPRLWVFPPVRSLRHAVERASVALLVGAAVLQLVTGLLNINQWYAFGFGFVVTHFWMSWVAVGALLVHVAVQLPAIRRGLRAPEPVPDDAAAGEGVLTRRRLLGAAAVSVGAVTVTTVGQTVRPLERLALFAPRRPSVGSLGLPVNRTAVAAAVLKTAVAPAYRLQVVGPAAFSLTLAELEGLPRVDVDLPITCVEGWSAGATWSGVRVRDLLDRAGAPPDARVKVVSLEEDGAYRESVLDPPHARSAQTLLALGLNGARLDLDHGYPVRLIAPNRPGVLQTKWVTRLEVLA